MIEIGDLTFTDGDCLALAERSPAAVNVHDKTAWLQLFAVSGMVEDPVGSRPHCARSGERRDEGPLGRFYETFIAANDIRFCVDRDIVCGLHVVRDLSLEIAMSTELTVRVPMHLLYELEPHGEQLRIARLAAHWELLPMLRQQLGLERASLEVGLLSTWRMLRHLGPGGVTGFMQALASVGEGGKRQVLHFSRCFNGRRELRPLFNNDAAVIAFPFGGTSLSVSELAQQGGSLSFEKLLAAGNVVSASCCYRVDDRLCEGVAFFELDRDSLKIEALTFYW